MVLVVNASVATEPMYFVNLNGQNGLTENYVKSITQDRLGFMWFGTKNGLNRYDGIHFKQYEIYDRSHHCGNNNVSALYEAPDGTLWVGTDKGVYLFNPQTEQFRLFEVRTADGVLIRNWIAQIVGDRQGNIWIVSPEEGLFCFNPRSRQMTRLKVSGPHNNPQSICVRSNGDVWIGTNGGGLYCVNARTRRVSHFLADRYGESLAGKDIYTLCDYGDYLAIGEHENRLMKLDVRTRRLSPVDAPEVHYKIIRSLAYDGRELFVGTQDGLFIINKAWHSVNHIKENHFVPYSLSDDMIYHLFLDRNKGLWIGTMYSGVDYMLRSGMIFRYYMPSLIKGSISSRRIHEMIALPDGKVWVTSEEGRIDIFDPETRMFTPLPTPIYKGGSNRLALLRVGDKVWSGLFKNGLDVIDVHTHALTHFNPQQLNLNSEGSIYALCKDHAGRVWAGTGDGLYLKGQGMKFTKIKAVTNVFVQDIQEDRRHVLWIATMGNGVYEYNPATGKAINYLHGSGNGISSSSVSSITFDHAGNLWFSTDRGGISFFNLKTRRFTNYSKADGLPDDVAYKILEDSHHHIWFGTNHGIVNFDPYTRAVHYYRASNGCIGNQFNYKSAVRLPDGSFLFGGSSGVIEFNPELSYRSRCHNKVLVTNIRVNGKELKPEDNGFLTENIVYSKEITLPHDMSTISLDISDLSYTNHEANAYEYRLEGYDEQWSTAVDGRDISYTQLPPGHYTFQARPLNDKASVTSLEIVIRHPWWSTPLAKAIYLMLMVFVVYYSFRTIHLRQMSKLKYKEQKYHAAMEKELLNSKINFFTNITHEIRTPLTLINGSVENLDDVKSSNPELNKNLAAIRKNCNRLLNLINQLLDFRKIDGNSLKLTFTQVDVCKLMHDIVSRFEPTINRQHKTISMDFEEDSLVMPVDREAFTKIVSNLLNNAMKYSETFIQIHMSVSDTHLIVSFINDGNKIPADKAEDIFKPFVRLDTSHKVPGSGFGLAMALSLAQLHHGTLTLDSDDEYNKFVLTLPLKQEEIIQLDTSADASTTWSGSEAASGSEMSGAQTATSGETSPSADDEPLSAHKNFLSDEMVGDYDFAGVKDFEYTLLVVEDNEEVLNMITDKLRDHYNLLMAHNGKEGLDTVLHNHVDLVITDIMMPVMDGLEMTKAIKENIEVNHIPVIMLTARQTLQNHIEGLKVGADAYIEKPFSMKYLLQQIETRLTNIRRERESFLHKPYLPVASSNVDKTKEECLDKITQLILQNINDPDFNVEMLAQKMCMSRSSLHRKIKEVANMTPIDFIRLIRLKKAAVLMKEDGYRVTEVCEKVGITSPSYFIKLFQRQFGMTPKEFVSGQKE